MGLASEIATKVATKTSSKMAKAKTAFKEEPSIINSSTKYEKTEILPESERSNNFEKKFEQTKVLDDNKKPAVMYHGRTKDFDEFDITSESSPTREIGIHFGPSEQANTFASKEGGNVVPVYLDIKNPLRLHDYGSFNSGTVLEQLRSEGFDQSIIDLIDDLPLDKQARAVVDLIKSKGYDGIVYLNRREGLNIKGNHDEVMRQLDEIADYDDKTLREKYGAKDSYVIFDPTQAKSVFNKGTYSESDNRFNYNKGGDVNNEMNKLLAEGGIMQEGGTVDPVSGNDVPVGAMQEEVRDDIDAKLSEGEFVFSADVVRYIGLEKLMMMRDKAKAGLQRMEDIGQMGNADDVESPEALHSGEEEDDDGFSSAVDQAMTDVDTQGFASGGYVQMAEGGVPSITQQAGTGTPLTKFSMKTFTNASGQTLYIPFLGTEALLQIPEGYTQSGGVTSTTHETPTAKDTITGGTASTDTTATGAGVGSEAQTGGWSSMTQAEQAAFYAANPTFSTVTTALQTAFGLTTIGKVQAALDPTFVSEQSMIARGVDPSTLGVETDNLSSFDADNAAAIASAESAITGESQAATQAAADAVSGGFAGEVGIDSGSVGGLGAGADSGASAGAAGGVGGSDSGGNDGGSDGAGWAKGGFVNKKKQNNKQKSLVSKK